MLKLMFLDSNSQQVSSKEVTYDQAPGFFRLLKEVNSISIDDQLFKARESCLELGEVDQLKIYLEEI
jgi:hypothetical protein